MAEVDLNKTKAKARGAMLEMARVWEKRGKIQHAIEGFEEVINIDPKSKEAGEAKDALLEIARKYDQAGKKQSAYHLYHKLAE